MEKTCKEEEYESLPTGVFELPGEPAIIINGVPPLPPINDAPLSCGIVNNDEPTRTMGFGEWMEGREIRKLFGDRYYSGKVIKFDKETRWYRVVYEDGDFEDLEWHELEQILLPQDVTVPLKAIATKVIKNGQKHPLTSGKTMIKSKKL